MENKRQAVTTFMVEKVKRTLEDPRYGTLTLDEIGLLTGCSGSTVSRIKNGRYDHLLSSDEDVLDSLTGLNRNAYIETVELLKSIDASLNSILEALK